MGGHSLLQEIFLTQRWNRFFRIVGRFFTTWATRKAQGEAFESDYSKECLDVHKEVYSVFFETALNIFEQNCDIYLCPHCLPLSASRFWHILQFHSLTLSYLGIVKFAYVPLIMRLPEQRKFQTV